MQSYTYVDKDAQLRGLVQQWRRQPVLAIDLEMEANLHHYGLHLALAQISDGKEVWLIDLLAIQDPEPLYELFENDTVQKIFHDVSFDFRALEELMGCKPKNIFDTKIAALLIGENSISLSGLLEKYFGVKKNEKFQKIDWMKRPLKPDMLAYAAGDVKYLVQLKEQLETKLEQLGRTSWLKEECEHLETQTYNVPERTYQDVKGARGITDEERGRLKLLYHEREKIAQKLNKPVFFIIPDKKLIEIVTTMPNIKQWQALQRVHPIIKKQAHKFITLLHKARPEQKQQREKRRLTMKQKEQVDALLIKRDVIAKKLGIEGYLLLSRDQAERIIQNEQHVLRNWQAEQLQEIL